jgi:transposase
MNPYPAKHSVLVMDNARIHHNEDLVAAVEDIGCRILYLPPYSPDLNPIETAFSALKSWLKRYRDLVNHFDPVYLILVALAQTTPEIAKKYFEESIYS